MLKREYQELTGTKVYPDVYEGIIEPMYLDAPAWMKKQDFCATINAELLSRIPAVPEYRYMIENKYFKCVKLDMVNQIVTLQHQSLKEENIVALKFDNAKAWRDKDYMKWI